MTASALIAGVVPWRTRPGEHGRQRLVGEDREGRRVVVLERRQEGEHRGREDGRASGTAAGCAKNTCVGVAPRSSAASSCAAVEALQARHEDQHAIGGDEGRLAEGRQEDAVVETASRRSSRVTSRQKIDGRDADDDAGRQHRRDDDEVVERARAGVDLASSRARRRARAAPTRRRPATPISEAVPQPVHQLAVGEQHAEPAAA